MDFSGLKLDEIVAQKLRVIFEQNGFIRANINKFEDYHLYVENQSFLESENIITFMDMNGNLLALKPDVTLSIAKNMPSEKLESFEKLYYIDEVYRLSKENKQYKVVSQIGVELMGPTDDFSNIEIVCLALECLKKISPKYVLDISHTGFISGLFDDLKLSQREQMEILPAIYSKSRHLLKEALNNISLSEDDKNTVLTLADLNGNLKEVLPKAEKIIRGEEMQTAYRELSQINNVLSTLGIGDNVNLDFSVIGDLDYYNGLIIQGYVEGAAKEVLSGGRYDKLMEKMGKNNGAIGFAVYLSELPREKKQEKEYDIDNLIRYNGLDNYADIIKLSNKLIAEGQSIRIEKMNISKDKLGFTYKNEYVVENSKLVEVKNNA